MDETQPLTVRIPEDEGEGILPEEADEVEGAEDDEDAGADDDNPELDAEV